MVLLPQPPLAFNTSIVLIFMPSVLYNEQIYMELKNITRNINKVYKSLSNAPTGNIAPQNNAHLLNNGS
jgi:hypothetical protein